MAQAGTVWVDVRGDMSQFATDVAEGAKKASAGMAGVAASGVKTVMGDIARSSAVAATALGVVGIAAVKTSSDFNAAMSGVGAVANASAAEMESLRNAALKAGADTVYSASQAADAQAELVKAGVSVSDVLGGALTGSLSLAAAGQLDLADAATISAQAMNVFGLGGDQVAHIADVLAAGANKSAADVGQLGDALRQGGLVAKQTGLSMEETVGVLSMFADSALVGSDAGTSLKTMLQRLVPQSDEAADAMARLGLDFFDAQGQFVGIAEVARQLQTSLGGLSDAQRQQALTTLFGSDAVRAASILMEGGAAAVDEYTAAVNDMGAAQRMASAQTDNLKGDVEAFKGSVETSLINLGDLGDSSLRSLVQAGTDVVNVFNDFASTPAWDAIGRNVSKLTDGLGGGLGGVADQLSAILDSIQPADVDRVFGRVSAAFETISDAASGLQGVIAGVGLSIAGLGARSVLGPLGGIVPVISPITGVLGGLVLGSDEGREALVNLGREAAKFATGTGSQLLAAASRLTDNLSRGLASALEDVGSAVIDAADTLGPVLGEAMDDLGPPIGELLEALGELVEAVLPKLADIAGGVLPPIFDVLGTGIGIAADAVGLLADNLWLAVPAIGAFVAVRFGDSIRGFADGIGAAVRGVGEFREAIAGIAATQGVSQFEALRGVARSSGGELRGLVSGLGGFNIAMIGATAAITAGVGIYEAWSRNVQRVDDETKQLTESIVEQGKAVGPTLANALRNILETRKGFDDAFSKSGMTIEGVSQVVNAAVGDMDKARQVMHEFTWGGSNQESLDRFRDSLDKVPASVRPVIKNMLDLNDAGVITAGEFDAIIDAMTDLDIEAQGTADSIAFNAEQMEKGIPAAQRTADVMRDIATASDTTAGLDAQRDALARLAAQFPEVAAAAGVAVGTVADANGNLADQTARAIGELRNLANEFGEIAGSAKDVDEAQRRYLDSQQSVIESIAKNGAGIDANTEAGRRNADALQKMIEQGQALAEAQAKMDVTGKTSTATLNGIVAVLASMRDQGQLTAEEYGKLLELYGLTPDQIETTVIAQTTDAKNNLTDLQAQFDAMKDQMSEPVRTLVQTLIDQGRYAEAERALNQVARDRQATVEVTVRQRQMVENWFGAAFANAAFGGKRAMGGPVTAGMPYLVGENGPEIVTFGGDGYVADAASSRKILDQPPTSLTLDPVLAQLVALRSEFAALADAMAAVATRPQQPPVIDVTATSGVAITARERDRAMRSGGRP